MKHESQATINFLRKHLSQDYNFNVTKLIPCLLNAEKNCYVNVTDLLQKYLEEKEPTDSGISIHNLIITLLSTLPENDKLEEYLDNNKIKHKFDMDYALRVFQKNNKILCGVYVYDIKEI